MPLFEFVCRQCHAEQEILIRGSETPVCSQCGGEELVKLLSAPVAHVPGGQPAPRQAGGGSCGSGCGCH
ncbi:MAG TPA: zinc ribbon domain-containing protein [Lacipirellulaceae bacterium]|nr:zinc ribbon domain-containing protein [Lacipirellulaceae bacterium]